MAVESPYLNQKPHAIDIQIHHCTFEHGGFNVLLEDDSRFCKLYIYIYIYLYIYNMCESPAGKRESFVLGCFWPGEYLSTCESWTLFIECHEARNVYFLGKDLWEALRILRAVTKTSKP